MAWKLILMVSIGFALEILPGEPNIAAVQARKVDLSDPVHLGIRYGIGEKLHYRLVRRSDFIAMDGSKFGGHEVIAYFTRTRLNDDDRGRAREEFTWKHFAYGQTMSGDQQPVLTALEEAEDYSLTFSVQDENAIETFDFSDMPRTIIGMWFMIMSWDAVTFDGAVRAQTYFDVPDAVRIGTEIGETRPPHDFTFDYPPILTESKYRFSGNLSARVLGVTELEGVACAIVDFSDAGNIIEMNMTLGPIESHHRGYEHFWGTTYVSLEDGRIVRGNLIAPVLQVQDMTMPGQDEPQHMEYLVLQRLEIDLLSREEFDSQVAGLRKPGGDR